MPVRAPPPLPQHDATWLNIRDTTIFGGQKLSWIGERDETGTNKTLRKQSFIDHQLNGSKDQAVEQVEVAFEEGRFNWSQMRFPSPIPTVGTNPAALTVGA